MSSRKSKSSLVIFEKYIFIDQLKRNIMQQKISIALAVETNIQNLTSRTKILNMLISSLHNQLLEARILFVRSQFSFF